uniref:Ankyrin repeat domain-containing protein 33B n=1 Tax=Cacopsylla melanoneura TaxID=428564 RepID=A0A8D8MFZ1_9HEMI
MKPVPSKWKPKTDPVLDYNDISHNDNVNNSRNMTPKRGIRRPMYIEDCQDSFTPVSTLRHSPSFTTKLTHPVSEDKLSPKTPRRSVPTNKSRRSSSPCIGRQLGDGRRGSDSKQPPAHDNKEQQRRKRTNESEEDTRTRLGRENTVPSKSSLGKGKDKQLRERWAGWESEGKRGHVEESRRRVHFELPVHVRPRKSTLRSGSAALPREYFSSSRRPLAPATGRLYNTAVALLRAAKDNEEELLYQALAAENLVESEDVNICDNTGRTAVSYIASNGNLEVLELLLQNKHLDINKPDNEGNTPLHFAAQAGQVESINFIITKCPDVEIDARNDLGFTPIMKAAIQGRTKCAKLLLVAGASPTMRDTGRGLRAEQWARFCGRYVCADVIEKLARNKLLERSTHVGKWGSDTDLVPHLVNGKLQPPSISFYQTQCHSGGLKSKLKKAFRTSSNPLSNDSAFSLVTQLTSAALCASSPVLPGQTPPVVKSLIRPLTVPKVQVTQVPDTSPPGGGSTKQKKKK